MSRDLQLCGLHYGGRAATFFQAGGRDGEEGAERDGDYDFAGGLGQRLRHEGGLGAGSGDAEGGNTEVEQGGGQGGQRALL